MFSKPIVIAASVATAQAALMKQGTTAYASATHGLSDAIGCGLCFEITDTTWVSKDATYGTIASAETVAVASNKVTGYVCCKDADTTETAAGAKTFCTAGMTAANGNINTKPTAGHYWQSVLAQCPHQKDNCTAAGKKADGTTALTISDDRLIELDELKATVTLTLKVIAAPGSTPSLKQRKGDVCTWVVYGKCDAPVITVPSTSGAITAATPEWKIQVTEWSGEFLDATNTWTAATQTGASGKLYYPPLADLSAKIIDIQATAPEKTAPNNLMGDVKFKTPAKTGTTYLSVPGNTLDAWMTNVKAVYDSYDKEVTAYNEENKKWKTYAEYSAPAPGLFDWLFGPTEDPDKPKTVSSPLQPTQPVDVPATIKNLAIGATTAPDSPAEYTAKSGYGYPQAFMLTPVASNTVRPFGVLAGGGQLSTTAVKAVDADSTYSMRKTSNKKDGKYITTCDKSYVMITGWLQVTPATALNIELVVTAAEFSNTLEERIPSRPGAVTAPVAAPAGAAQLAASAVAAALTALYLF